MIKCPRVNCIGGHFWVTASLHSDLSLPVFVVVIVTIRLCFHRSSHWAGRVVSVFVHHNFWVSSSCLALICFIWIWVHLCALSICYDQFSYVDGSLDVSFFLRINRPPAVCISVKPAAQFFCKCLLWFGGCGSRKERGKGSGREPLPLWQRQAKAAPQMPAPSVRQPSSLARQRGEAWGWF